MPDPTTFIHPSLGTDAQRKAAMADVNDRMARVMARVAADPKQSKQTRAFAARDHAAAISIAAKLRSA